MKRFTDQESIFTHCFEIHEPLLFFKSEISIVYFNKMRIKYCLFLLASSELNFIKMYRLI